MVPTRTAPTEAGHIRPARNWRVGQTTIRVADVAASDAEGRLTRLSAEYDVAPHVDAMADWDIEIVDTDGDGATTLDLKRRVARLPRVGAASLTVRASDLVCRIVLSGGHLPLHGALLVPPSSAKGVLLLGGSGHGKSTLTWLAVRSGWRCVSDDLVVLREESRRSIGGSVRRRLRIPMSLASETDRKRGRRLRGADLEKLRIDPDVLGPMAFVPEVEIGQLVFLVRGERRCRACLPRHAVFARLLKSSLADLDGEVGRAQVTLLRSLADRAQGAELHLTARDLEDPETLEHFWSRV